MQSTSTLLPTNTFSWTQESILTHAPKLLKHKLYEIADLASHKIKAYSCFKKLDGRNIKEQIK